MNVRPARFIDIGINLLDDMFKGKYNGSQKHQSDFEQILERAKTFNVVSMIITAGMEHEVVEAAELARKLGVFCTAGTHPTRCNEWKKNGASPEAYLSRLKANITKYRDVVVAVGECGLDYDRLFFCDKETQLQFFPPQILVAAEFKLPLFLHDRNTDDDFFKICQAHRKEIETCGGGVVHSFTGTEEHLKRLLEFGFYISVNGCSFKEEWQLDVAKKIPLNRLMLETDGPYCQVKNTHASSKLLASCAKMLQDDKVDQILGIPAVEPVAMKPEKFQLGAPVKSRCEPFEITKVFKIMYCLRKDELIGGPSQLAEMCYANTVRLFGDRFNNNSKPAATTTNTAATTASPAAVSK